MADIYTNRILGILGGTTGINTLTSTSASGGVATTTITGDIWFDIRGTFSSANIALQVRNPNGVYASVSGTTITAAAQQYISFPQYARNTFRFLVGPSTTDTLLSIWVVGANGSGN